MKEKIRGNCSIKVQTTCYNCTCRPADTYTHTITYRPTSRLHRIFFILKAQLIFFCVYLVILAVNRIGPQVSATALLIPFSLFTNNFFPFPLLIIKNAISLVDLIWKMTYPLHVPNHNNLQNNANN